MTAKSWIDHITNDAEVRAIIPNGLLLDALRFSGVSLQPGNILIVELHTESVPLGVPSRWSENGAQFLSITFRIGVRSATVNVREVDEMPLVTVLLQDGEFAVNAAQATGAAALQVAAHTFFVEAKLKPMQASQLRP